MGHGGLLRLPRFYRAFLQTVSTEMESRAQDELPKLISPEVRYRDAGIALSFAVLLIVARVRLEDLISKRATKLTARSRRRLTENLFYTVYYVMAFSFYLLVLVPSVDWSSSLFTNKNEIVPTVLTPYPPPMNVAERVYYVQAGGYYISVMFFLILFDPRRSDFFELMLHHFVTLALVVGSYSFGYVRIGIIILALHDIGDIFLYGAKTVHYLGYSGWDTFLFAIFAVTFYVTRLVMYSRLVYAISVETLQSVIEIPSLCNWAKFYETYVWHHLAFSIFMCALLVLHCFWFALILRMIHRELFLGKKVSDEGDIRSDDEDD